MKIKALRGFSGMVTMTKDEERDVRDEIALDLINAGYAECLDNGSAVKRSVSDKSSSNSKPDAKAKPGK